MEMKKARERRVIEQLRRCWPHFPAGDLREGERPDFIIETPGGTCVGIEVTTYHRPGISQLWLPAAQESLRCGVANRMTKILRSEPIPPLYVTLLFNDTYPLMKGAISVVACALARLVSAQAASLAEGGQVVIDSYLTELPREVVRIDAARWPRLTESVCGPVQTAMVPTLGVEEFERIIATKATKADFYRERCVEVVLVIEIDGFRFSSIANLDDTVRSHRFDSPFSKVIVLVDGREAIELCSGD